MGLRSRNRVQGDPSGPRLHFVDFDLAVMMSALFCLGSCKSGRIGMACKQHCLTRSDVTSVERGVRMSQCGQTPLGMCIEGVGDSHFS